MNVAAGLSLASASVNVATSIFHLSLSPAPGWRAARTFAAVAFTAGLYSICGIVFALDGLSDASYVLAGRITYLVGNLHCIAWLVYAYGGPRGSPRYMPVPIRWLAICSLGLSVFFATTGLGLREPVTVVEVPWAGVRYHYPLTTTPGDIYGFLMPACLAVAFFHLLVRFRRGERALRWHSIGFSVFFVCAVVEVLAANRVIVFPSIVDIGILAVVLPLTIHVVERLIEDARRLRVLTGELSGEVHLVTQERDRVRSALLEAEQFAKLGRLAAGVGHQINNPLMYLQMALSELEYQIEQDGTTAPVREALAGVRDGAGRIEKVVEVLRGYLRAQGESTVVDLADVAAAALNAAGPQLGQVARVETDFGAVPRVLADEPRLVQAVVNLIVNAVQAVCESGGSKVVLRTATTDTGGAELSVIDDGPGIPDEVLGRVGEPYVTTRASAGGLGLGLFLARGIAVAHGGRLDVDSKKGSGTRVSIVLPALTAGTVSPARTSQVLLPGKPVVGDGETAGSRQGRLLLVDDEPLVLKYLTRGLHSAWDVTSAESGAEALRLAGSQPFDTVVCDLMMPGMSGMEFAEQLARSNPALRARVLFLTAGALTEREEAFLQRPDVVHLTKPVRIRDLDSALHALTSGTPPRRG